MSAFVSPRPCGGLITISDDCASMRRGIEIGIYLQPGLHEEDFVALAIGNLAAYRLQQDRGEALEWQVLRVESSSGHHFRLVVHHRERVLDLGIKENLSRILKELSDETIDQLRERFKSAQREGLKPVPLRLVKEETDLWQDDFWNHIG
jgi:Protein of unknown function (DUF2004)